MKIAARFAGLLGTWSVPAALRALRAAIVVPALLALTFKGFSAPQVTTYATFGGFAHLVMTSFTGDRRRRLIDHLGLGIAGTVLITLGTLVNGSALAAGLVTLVVSFVVFEAGALAPNVAAAGLPAMLVYVLPAASPGAVGTIPARLGGWWLVTGVATAIIVAMTPRKPERQLRTAAAETADAMAREAQAIASASATGELQDETRGLQGRLIKLMRASPVRPTALSAADYALGGVVEGLGWVGTLLSEAAAAGDQGPSQPADRALVTTAAQILTSVAQRLRGERATIDVGRLESERRQRAPAALAGNSGPTGQPDPQKSDRALAHSLFHATSLALAVRNVAVEAMVATRQASVAEVAQMRREWAAAPAQALPAADGKRPVATAVRVWTARANLRSVWAVNSARSALAVAAAVTVATLTDVQHGFWVVLGTLVVLRTTAVATGSTALRALLGTTLGVLVGGAIVLGVGTNTDVLWALMPVVLLVAAYTPGVSPFAAGQAAFSIFLVILYNLLVPVGWKVGEIRLEDVAIGVGISLVTGVLLWPRGVASVVAEDFNDAVVAGARYFMEGAAWALGTRAEAPATGRPAVEAGLRLEDAMRSYLAEPGSKPVEADELWYLVGTVKRLRLMATSLVDIPPVRAGDAPTERMVAAITATATWFETVGSHVRYGQPSVLVPPSLTWREASDEDTAGNLAYVEELLRHLQIGEAEVARVATEVRQAVHRPWWHPHLQESGPGTFVLLPSPQGAEARP